MWVGSYHCESSSLSHPDFSLARGELREEGRHKVSRSVGRSVGVFFDLREGPRRKKRTEHRVGQDN